MKKASKNSCLTPESISNFERDDNEFDDDLDDYLEEVLIFEGMLLLC